MYCDYPKSGKKGKAKSYKNGTGGKNQNTSFYDSQGTFARRPEHERVDLYAKPGTSAARRQGEPMEVSLPRSRYRSQFP